MATAAVTPPIIVETVHCDSKATNRGVNNNNGNIYKLDSNDKDMKELRVNDVYDQRRKSSSERSFAGRGGSFLELPDYNATRRSLSRQSSTAASTANLIERILESQRNRAIRAAEEIKRLHKWNRRVGYGFITIGVLVIIIGAIIFAIKNHSFKRSDNEMINMNMMTDGTVGFLLLGLGLLSLFVGISVAFCTPITIDSSNKSSNDHRQIRSSSIASVSNEIDNINSYLKAYQPTNEENAV